MKLNFFVSLSLACIAACLFSTSAIAQETRSFDAASQNIDQRLQDALDEYAAVTRQITEEKVPVSTRIRTLETKLAELTKLRDQLKRATDASAADVDRKQRTVDQLANSNEFLTDQLTQFVNEFSSRLDFSEANTYADLVDAALNATESETLNFAEVRERQLAVVDAALDRMLNLIGGDRYPGTALGQVDNAVEASGTFISVGPQVFFSSEDGSLVGLVEPGRQGPAPSVAVLPSGLTDGIAQLASTGEGSLPLDSTLGSALKKEQASKTLGQYIEDGGVIGYVIIALGSLALLITAFKVFEISKFSTPSSRDVEEVLKQIEKGDQKAAMDRAAKARGAGREILEEGVTHSDKKRSLVEELLFESILRARPYLERFLPFLAITAAASPLLGLLGTVVGMIKTFQLITIFGTGDARSLSSGISEALITTALGLIVAIPVLILHGLLARMAKRKVGLLEQGAVSFVNGLTTLRHTKGETQE
ncbi:MAG: MotA/TolQ/ExbB proton channel family protein [Opitutales bacterium]